MATSIGNLALILSAAGGSLEKGLKAASSSMQTFGSATASAASMVASTSLSIGTAIAGASASVVSFGAKLLGLQTDLHGMIQVGIDFERQMSIVGAMTNATGGEFDAMREEARRLGRDTEFTASQAAQAMSQLGQHKFAVKDILEGTKSVVALASVLKVDIPTAAVIASDALGGFGMHAGDLERVNDVIAHMLTHANTGGAEAIQDAFKYIATTAQSAGKSIEEISAALMILNNAGIKGSEAGSALSRFMTKMAKQTPAAQKAMDELGISFEDSKGNFRDFGAIFDDLQKVLSKMGKAKRLEFVSKIFDVRAGRAAAVFGGIEGVADQYRKNLADLEKAAGTAKRIAGKQLQNVWGAIKIAQSSWEGFVESVYASVQGDLKTGIDRVTGLFNSMRDGVGGAVGNIRKFLEPLQKPFAKIDDNMMRAFSGVAKDVGDSLQRIGDRTGPVLEKISVWFAKFTDGGIVVRQTFDVVIAAGERFIDWITVGAEKLFGSMSPDRFRDNLIAVLIAVEYFFVALPELYDVGTTRIAVFLSEWFDMMENQWTYIVDLLKWGTKSTAELLTAWSRSFGAVFSNIKDNAMAFGESMKNFLKDPTSGFHFTAKEFNFDIAPTLFDPPKVKAKASAATELLREELRKMEAKVGKDFDQFAADKSKKFFDAMMGGGDKGSTTTFSHVGWFVGLLEQGLAISEKISKDQEDRYEKIVAKFSGVATAGSADAFSAIAKFRFEQGQMTPDDPQKQQVDVLKDIRKELKDLNKKQGGAPVRVFGLSA